MRELSVTLPVAEGEVMSLNDIVVSLTEDDAKDLNNGYSITTLTPSGEEVAVFPV